MRQKKLAIGLRLSAARGSIGNAVRQSLGNLKVTEDDISNVSGVGVIDHFGARKARHGSNCDLQPIPDECLLTGVLWTCNLAH